MPALVAGIHVFLSRQTMAVEVVSSALREVL
jgi:hypothetical protein